MKIWCWRRGFNNTQFVFPSPDSHMKKAEFPKTTADRVKSMIELRELARGLLDAKRYGVGGAELREMQGRLNAQYYNFF